MRVGVPLPFFPEQAQGGRHRLLRGLKLVRGIIALGVHTLLRFELFQTPAKISLTRDDGETMGVN